jgi:hypothetical protein
MVMAIKLIPIKVTNSNPKHILFRMSTIGKYQNPETKKFMFKLEYSQGTTNINDPSKSVGPEGASNIWIQESNPANTVEKVTGFEEIQSEITDSACWRQGQGLMSNFTWMT